MNNILFIGEEKSELARTKGWSWEDGRLAAKQLFDALRANSVEPSSCRFLNLFEESRATIAKAAKGNTVIALGRKVQRGLIKYNIKHYNMVHPAARGKIRNKQNYINHVTNVLNIIRNETNKG